LLIANYETYLSKRGEVVSLNLIALHICFFAQEVVKVCLTLSIRLLFSCIERCIKKDFNRKIGENKKTQKVSQKVTP